MAIRLLVAAVLLHAGTTRSQDRNVPDRRLGAMFARVITASRAGDHLTERVAALAKQYKVPKKNADQVTSSIGDILEDIGNELGDDFTSGDADTKSRIRAIITGVRTKPESVELTKAWEKAVKSLLSESQFEAWNKDRKKRHADLVKELTDQVQQRQVRIQPDGIAVRAARMAPAARPIPAGRMTRPDMFRSLVDRYRSSFEQSLQTEVTRLVALCGLNQKQVRRLEVARKGAISKTFDGVSNELNELNQNGGEVSEALRARLGELRTPDRSFWQKAVHSTLTEEQRTTLAEEEKKQADFRRVAYAYQLTAYMDGRTPLADNQRVRLLEILTQLPSGGAASTAARSSVSRWSSELPDEALKAIEQVLTPAQWQAVQSPRTAPRPRGALTPFRAGAVREEIR